MSLGGIFDLLRSRKRGQLGAELQRGGIGSGGMRIAEIALGVASAILLARLLGVAGLGLYSVVIATVTLMGLPIEFGFPALVTREVARAHAKGDWNGVHAVLSFANRAILIVSLILGALAISLWPVLTALLPSEKTGIFGVALAIPPLVALANVRAAALRGIRRPLLGTAPETIIRPCCFLALLGAAAIAGDGWLSPARAIALNVVAAGLSLGFAFVALRRHAPRRQPENEPPPPLRDWLVASVVLGAQRGLRVAQPQILLLVVGALGSVEAAGLFRIAQRGASLASLGHTTVVVLIAPYVSGLHASGDRARLQRLITASARLIAGAGLAAFALFLCAGRPLLALLFGAEFVAAQPALVVLSLGSFLAGIVGPAHVVMTMLHHERVAVAVLIAVLLASTVLCAALVGPFGAVGAAAAAAAGLVSVELLLWRLANRRLGLRTSAFGI